MRLSSWTAVALAAVCVAGACTTRRVKADDDDGFGGGLSIEATGGGGAATHAAATNAASSNAASSTAASTSAAVSTAASSSTGPQGCDTNVPADYGDPACTACIQCTMNGACATEWSACSPSTPCDQYWDCLIDCDTQCNGDPTCMDTCVGVSPDPNNPCSSQTPQGSCIGDNPAGCNDYVQALSCSVCIHCPTNCNAAGNCS